VSIEASQPHGPMSFLSGQWSHCRFRLLNVCFPVSCTGNLGNEREEAARIVLEDALQRLLAYTGLQ
jgi:hypothetical protein